MSLFLIAMLTSCVTSDYHLDVSGAQDTYTESYGGRSLASMLSNELGVTVTSLSGDTSKIETSGNGGRISISESTKLLMSKVGYTKVSYDDIPFIFDVNGTVVDMTMSMEASIIDLSVGLRLSYLTPYFSLKNLSIDLETKSSQGVSLGSSAGGVVTGWGVDLDIPIGKGFLYARYSNESLSQQEYTTNNGPPSMQTTELSYESIGLGYRFYIGTIKGAGGRKPSSK